MSKVIGHKLALVLIAETDHESVEIGRWQSLRVDGRELPQQMTELFYSHSEQLSTEITKRYRASK